MSRGDYDDTDGEPRPLDRRSENARDRVALPGLFLIIIGLISVVIVVGLIAVWWIAPDVVAKPNYDLMKDLTKNQPGAVPPYDDFVKQQRIQSTGIGILQLVGSIFIFLGGIKMRALQGYGIAMTGSIMAIIPLCTNYCCCTSMPFGIWALVVLMNADVKAAFRSSSAPQARGYDDFEDRR